MGVEEITRLRRKVIPRASGVVLEMGVGSGLNLPLYTSAVTKLYALDPSRELIAMATPRAARLPFPVEFLNQDAHPIPLADESVDTVVVTWSLCSIDDPESALVETRRVLKPAGTLIFVEHGLSPDAAVQKWQNRLTPIWRRVAGGCHLNRRIDEVIRSAGFTTQELRTGYVPGPKPLTYMYEGCAGKSNEPAADDPSCDC